MVRVGTPRSQARRVMNRTWGVGFSNAGFTALRRVVQQSSAAGTSILRRPNALQPIARSRVPTIIRGSGREGFLARGSARVLTATGLEVERPFNVFFSEAPSRAQIENRLRQQYEAAEQADSKAELLSVDDLSLAYYETQL